MEADEDIEIDPAIAAAMGFTGFGSQTSKKRKFDPNIGFVDPSISRASSAATGANSIPASDVKSTKVTDRSTSATVDNETKQQNPDKLVGPPSLEALRHGIRNDRGDMVYFLSSFTEDPWAGLKPH